MKKLILLASFVFVLGSISVSAQAPKKPAEKAATTETVKKPVVEVKKAATPDKKNDGKKNDGKKNDGKKNDGKKNDRKKVEVK